MVEASGSTPEEKDLAVVAAGVVFVVSCGRPLSGFVADDGSCAHRCGVHDCNMLFGVLVMIAVVLANVAVVLVQVVAVRLVLRVAVGVVVVIVVVVRPAVLLLLAAWLLLPLPMLC